MNTLSPPSLLTVLQTVILLPPHPTVDLIPHWMQEALGACPAALNEEWSHGSSVGSGKKLRSCYKSKNSVKQWFRWTVPKRRYFRHVNYEPCGQLGTSNSICMTVFMGKLIVNIITQDLQTNSYPEDLSHTDTHHLLGGLSTWNLNKMIHPAWTWQVFAEPRLGPERFLLLLLPPYSSSCLQHLKEPPTPSRNQSSLSEELLHLLAHRTL